MSKAFKSEETEASVARRPIVRAAPGEERPITPEGHARLLSRLGALKAERAALLASAPADLAERKDALDHAVVSLEATIESVRIVEPSGDTSRAGLGRTVTIRTGTRERSVRLVGPDEAMEKDDLSIASPLGAGLVGATAGTEVEIERPGDVLLVTVLSVR